MTASGKAIRRIFFRMWPRHGGSGPLQEYVCDEQPLRDELFSADQMEQHGKTLAGMHTVESGTRSRTGFWRGWPRMKASCSKSAIC